MKKKIIMISFLIIILLFSLIMFLFKVDLKTNTIHIEYGEKINIKGEDILKTKNKIILNSFKTEKIRENIEVGTYKINISYNYFFKKINDEITLIVEDTTPPEFTDFKEEIILNYDDNSYDFNNDFKAHDLSDFKIIFDTQNINYKSPGSYILKITLIDEYENKTEKESVIIIKEKENIDNNENVIENKFLKYVDGILIVNKKYGLPETYDPKENSEAKTKLMELINDMKKLGYDVSNSYSGYRTYEYQRKLYLGYVNVYGQEETDTFSARPGHSEHQTGLSFDLLHSNGTLLEKENEINWLKDNAYKYGFIIRYPKGKEDITGYNYEPWHIRYIGNKSKDIYESGLTLEEYLNVEGGDYE